MKWVAKIFQKWDLTSSYEHVSLIIIRRSWNYMWSSMEKKQVTIARLHFVLGVIGKLFWLANSPKQLINLDYVNLVLFGSRHTLRVTSMNHKYEYDLSVGSWLNYRKLCWFCVLALFTSFHFTVPSFLAQIKRKSTDLIFLNFYENQPFIS